MLALSEENTLCERFAFSFECKIVRRHSLWLYFSPSLFRIPPELLSFSVQKGEGLSNHASFTFKHAWKQNWIEISVFITCTCCFFYLSMLTRERGSFNIGDARVGVKYLYRQKVPKNMSGPQHWKDVAGLRNLAAPFSSFAFFEFLILPIWTLSISGILTLQSMFGCFTECRRLRHGELCRAELRSRLAGKKKYGSCHGEKHMKKGRRSQCFDCFTLEI